MRTEVLGRVLFYVVVTCVAARIWWVCEHVSGNGGKAGVRYILVALVFTWTSVLLGTALKLCGVPSEITSWAFTVAVVITLVCLYKLSHLRIDRE